LHNSRWPARIHYNSLANYAYSFLKSRQDAEDIVQEVFIKLWKNKPEVMHSNQVKFYLLTATKNACISFLRKQAGKYTVEPESVHLIHYDDWLRRRCVKNAPSASFNKKSAIQNCALSFLI